MVEVKHGVFGVMGNNSFIITDSASGKSAVVDCPENSKKMLDFVSGLDLEYILLTHGHFDHIGGVKAVKELTGAKVVIAKEDEGMLKSGEESLAFFSGIFQEAVAADITVSDNDSIMLGESEIKVIKTPGHTRGSVCYIADKELFTGDTLFKCSYGRTDFPGGSTIEMAMSLKTIFSLEGDYNVYPGHEGLSTLDFERKHNIEANYLINRV